MDEQVELLRGIWNEMKALNGRVTTTNERLDDLRSEFRSEMGGLRTEMRTEMGGVRTQMGELRAELRAGLADLGERIEQVHSRGVEWDMRLATTLVEVRDDVHEIRQVMLAWHDEHRIDKSRIDERLDRLERHVGLEPR
jgi:hypothetical protein